MRKKHRRRETGEAILTKYGANRSDLLDQQRRGILTDPELLDALDLLEEEVDADTEPAG
jgi:hypothetical protein